MRASRKLGLLLALAALGVGEGLQPSAVSRVPRCLARRLRAHMAAIDPPSKPGLPPQAARPPPLSEPPNQPRLLPLAVLLLVPAAWGTYGVAIKQLFALDVPPPVRTPTQSCLLQSANRGHAPASSLIFTSMHLPAL